jgi:hypothetical protein
MVTACSAWCLGPAGLIVFGGMRVGGVCSTHLLTDNCRSATIKAELGYECSAGISFAKVCGGPIQLEMARQLSSLGYSLTPS